MICGKCKKHHATILEEIVCERGGDSVTKPVTQSVTSARHALRQPVTKPPSGSSVTKPVTVKHCPTCRCGAIYPGHAARQRAYRERKAKREKERV